MEVRHHPRAASRLRRPVIRLAGHLGWRTRRYQLHGSRLMSVGGQSRVMTSWGNSYLTRSYGWSMGGRQEGP